MPVTRPGLLAQNSGCQLLTGLLASGGIHIEILEEDLGKAGRGNAVIADVRTLDVDRLGGGGEGVSFPKMDSPELVIFTVINITTYQYKSLRLDRLQVWGCLGY